MVQEKEQTEEELIEMYGNLEKSTLIAMLINCNQLIDRMTKEYVAKRVESDLKSIREAIREVGEDSELLNDWSNIFSQKINEDLTIEEMQDVYRKSLTKMTKSQCDAFGGTENIILTFD
jgi:hypothetical protein